ncbi:MAG: restriction endonuclease subunit S, partial [Rhodospirillales bacterium]|nr:restriction endonuclease subunit S [Rhodospirillales bacterium]
MSAFPPVPLAEVCTIIGGGTPRRSNAEYFHGTIPWATPTDVTALDSLFIKRTKETITETGLNKSSARLVPVGTVLMTSRATIGYTAIATQPMATNQGFANLICSNRINPEYLAYWLRDQREQLIQLAGGTTFRELPKSTLKKVHIPLPPLDEQQRIVGILNRVAKIERLRAQAQERLREFIPALFIRMFGDPVRNPHGYDQQTLSECANFISGATPSK